TIQGDAQIGNGNLRVDLNAPNVTGNNQNDVVQVNGALTLNGSTALVINRPAAGLANGTYGIMRSTGAITGGAPNFVLPTGTRPTLAILTGTGTVDLSVTGNPSLSLTWSAAGGNNNAWDLQTTSNWVNPAVQQFFNWDN